MKDLNLIFHPLYHFHLYHGRLMQKRLEKKFVITRNQIISACMIMMYQEKGHLF